MIELGVDSWTWKSVDGAPEWIVIFRNQKPVYLAKEHSGKPIDEPGTYWSVDHAICYVHRPPNILNEIGSMHHDRVEDLVREIAEEHSFMEC